MKPPCPHCGGQMFHVTSVTRSTSREDHVGNISGVSDWQHRTVRVRCEKCRAVITHSWKAADKE